MITLFYDEYPCDHYKKEIAKADRDLENHHIGPVHRLTGSEHYILRILQAVRCGILRTDEIKLYCYGKPIDIDVKGEFIQPWPDELFDADFHLRFGKFTKPNDDSIT